MAPPVVLVHGFGTSFDLTWVSNGWVDLLADEGREVIDVDLLGHGKAPKPTDPEAYGDLGERVRDALPSDGSVDAVGFSLGAKTLLKVAAAEPGRFRSLVVAGVGANLFRSTDHTPVIEAIRTGDDGEDPTLRYFAGLAELPGNDRAALAACMANGGGGVTADELGRITCPVLVVLGDADFAGPADPWSRHCPTHVSWNCPAPTTPRHPSRSHLSTPPSTSSARNEPPPDDLAGAAEHVPQRLPDPGRGAGFPVSMLP